MVARVANYCSVGVTWGFRSRGELMEAVADVIVDSAGVLREALLHGV
ncbi:MAG: hypothetical protein IJG63_00755 [Oscillospiraceae bacterium]|nr:hypothetical protein [Oscillospiraceae bacterium]